MDGYSGNGSYSEYFHLNWGWGGSNDGNFYLSDLSPASSDFTYNQSAVINIFPGSNSAFPIFKDLENQNIFKLVKVDCKGYGISWNEYLDLSRYEIWENGK